MPPDEKILKSAQIQKITNRYQDVNKNEVKFRGKIPVNLEYENNKQKMEIFITERTDITPLLGMDWMKKFRLTIGKIQLAENNQSKREKVFNKFPDQFENNETIKDMEINIQLKPGHYSIKQKARPVHQHLQEDEGRTSGEDKRCGRRLLCVTGGKNRKKRQIGKNSTGLTETKRQLRQNETTYAEYGGIVKPNFGKNHTRPNSPTIHVKDRFGLRIRPDGSIRRNKPTMRIRNNWGKILLIIPIQKNILRSCRSTHNISRKN